MPRLTDLLHLFLFAPDEPAGGAGDDDTAAAAQAAADAAAAAAADEDETVTMTKAQHDALQQSVAEAKKAERKAKADARAATEAANADDAEARAKAAEERREALETKLTASARKDAVTQVATRLKFLNPALANSLIKTDDLDVDLEADDGPAVDAATVSIIETRLTEVAKENGYLVGEAATRQLPGAGGSSSGGAATGGNAAMNAAIRSAAGR